MGVRRSKEDFVTQDGDAPIGHYTEIVDVAPRDRVRHLVIVGPYLFPRGRVQRQDSAERLRHEHDSLAHHRRDLDAVGRAFELVNPSQGEVTNVATIDLAQRAVAGRPVRSGVGKPVLTRIAYRRKLVVRHRYTGCATGTGRRGSQGAARGVDRADEGFQLPHRCVRQGVRPHGRVGNAEANGAIHRPIALTMRELATDQTGTAATAPVWGVAFSALTAKQRGTGLNVGRRGVDVAEHRVGIVCLDEGSQPLARTRPHIGQQLR